MNATPRPRRGMSSVLAMIYLSLMAALAVGFYTAIDTSTNIADNEQFIHHTSTAAEAAFAFTRYQLSQVTIPCNAPYGNLLSTVLTQLQSGNTLTGYGGLNSYSGNALNPAISNGSIVIPAPNANGTPNWMTADAQGGKAYIQISVGANSSATAPQLVVLTVAQDSNSRLGSTSTPITRKLQLLLNGSNPAYTYGLYSNGEIQFGNTVKVSGPGGAPVNVFVVDPKANPTPLAVSNSSSSISGGLYWTSNLANPNLAGLSLGGVGSSSPSFASYEHDDQPVTAPAFDTTQFAKYVGGSAGYGGTTYTPGSYSVTPLNNCWLKANASGSGNYTFNRASLTINGILYLDPGVTVNFNNSTSLTVNGCIVQANSAATNPGTLIFSGPVTQTAYSGLSGPNYPAAETALTGTFLLTPDENATFNSTVASVGSIISNSLVFNANASVSGGSIMVLGAGAGLSFTKPATLTVNPVSSYPSGETFTFPTVPSSYTEINP